MYWYCSICLFHNKVEAIETLNFKVQSILKKSRFSSYSLQWVQSFHQKKFSYGFSGGINAGILTPKYESGPDGFNNLNSMGRNHHIFKLKLQNLYFINYEVLRIQEKKVIDFGIGFQSLGTIVGNQSVFTESSQNPSTEYIEIVTPKSHVFRVNPYLAVSSRPIKGNKGLSLGIKYHFQGEGMNFNTFYALQHLNNQGNSIRSSGEFKLLNNSLEFSVRYQLR